VGEKRTKMPAQAYKPHIWEAEFKASLSYIAEPCLKNQINKQKFKKIKKANANNLRAIPNISCGRWVQSLMRALYP
jgi:hypothetical protein